MKNIFSVNPISIAIIAGGARETIHPANEKTE